MDGEYGVDNAINAGARVSGIGCLPCRLSQDLNCHFFGHQMSQGYTVIIARNIFWKLTLYISFFKFGF